MVSADKPNRRDLVAKWLGENDTWVTKNYRTRKDHAEKTGENSCYLE